MVFVVTSSNVLSLHSSASVLRRSTRKRVSFSESLLSGKNCWNNTTDQFHQHKKTRCPISLRTTKRLTNLFVCRTFTVSVSPVLSLFEAVAVFTFHKESNSDTEGTVSLALAAHWWCRVTHLLQCFVCRKPEVLPWETRLSLSQRTVRTNCNPKRKGFQCKKYVCVCVSVCVFLY